MQSLIISGATIMDGVAQKATNGRSIWIEGSRIKAIGAKDELGIPPGSKVIDARGKYVIPGLMNANVHLSMGIMTVERAARHMNRSEDIESIIVEAAQVSLKNGLTTVFDTCGLRRPLIAARDKINAGELTGSRIFCAGWIVGFDGLFSADFTAKASEVLSTTFANRINAICVENVGRHLMWLTPEQVATEVRSYIGTGIDFIKYGSNEHVWAGAGAFLAFSPRVQEAIVAEARRANISVQAHTMSVEGLRVAIEAGCDLIQHANITGPVPIPHTTLDLMAKKNIGTVVFPFTEKMFEWVMKQGHDQGRVMWKASDANVRNLIRSGVPLMLANDGMIFPPEMKTDPKYSKSWALAPDEDNIAPLATGHFAWFKAMEEKGCAPMEMLKAATKNIAHAYGKDKDLGTLEKGKIADLLILDKDPLQAAQNYASIHMVLKNGALVDRAALPMKPILTLQMEPPAEEEASYVPASRSGSGFPLCPMCLGH